LLQNQKNQTNKKLQTFILTTMKTSIKSLSLVTGILATIAFILLCATAKADLVNITATAYSANGSWATDPGGNNPFYSTANLAVFSNFSNHGAPAPAAGASASLLAETITITNGAGNIGLASSLTPNTNYVLTGISVMISGYDSTHPVSLHIFDVTTNLTGGLLSSTATYNFTANGDLLGGGSGLLWTNAQLSGAEQQVYLGLQKGPLSQDQIVLASNHIYAVEIWVPTSDTSFYWFKSSAAPQDIGGWFMAGNNTSLTVPRLAANSSTFGFTGSSDHTWAIALYGYPTNAAATVNNTTNAAGGLTFIIDEFNPLSYGPTNIYVGTNDYSLGQITNIWGNWFGGAFTNLVWDSTVDAQNNSHSGAMKITAVYPASGGGQYCVTDIGTGPNSGNANSPGINPPITSGYALVNFQCDVRFDPSSCVTSNGSVANYGHLQFGVPIGTTGQDVIGSLEVAAGNTNWVHVNIPLSEASDANLASITGVFFKLDGNYYSHSALSGTNILWVDNIQITALSGAPPAPPPPVMAIQKAIPALRIYAGSTVNTYDRAEVATVDGSQSWIGGSYPVSYSFTLLSYPNNNINQTHIFLVPTSPSLLGGNAVHGNEYIEYQAANALWLAIGPNGAGRVTATVEWKTNAANANPNQTALVFTNSTAIGTWTLTFTDDNHGSVTAPGGSPVGFTITNGTVATDFANPLTAYFGLQPNSTAGEGLYEDWASISVTGVVGAQENEDFTKESSDFDTTYYTSPSGQFICDSSAKSGLGSGSLSVYPVFIVRTNLDQYWVNWTLPAIGYALGTKTNLLQTGKWINPAYYSAYFDQTAPRGNPVQLGTKDWELLPTDDLPTVDKSQDGVPAPTAFFLSATNVLSP
jgi:hypothetical protein